MDRPPFYRDEADDPPMIRPKLKVLRRIGSYKSAHYQELPQLSFLTPLATGPRRWSQTWRGTLRRGKDHEAPRETVVIKLFQQSQFPAVRSRRSGSEVAKSERTAFDALRDLQGRHAYGGKESDNHSLTPFYWVSPCPTAAFSPPQVEVTSAIGYEDAVGVLRTEKVMAHVMEYIPGFAASDITDPEMLPEDTGNMLRRSLDEIHKCGVVHRDLCGYNIIIVQEPTKGLRCVFIDFAKSKVYTDRERALRPREGKPSFEEAMADDKQRLNDVFFELDIDQPDPQPVAVTGFGKEELAELLAGLPPVTLDDFCLSETEWLEEVKKMEEKAKRPKSKCTDIDCPQCSI
ncbi:hypothetical protein V5O48_011327 [Marasmius crinis-equi]|uniref:non-specific serine/threonine protein kinase n=1 Tax=Marasmius crinis-equi TaxID=585013 RepID=A0ABR3F5X0_9AGAR